MNQLEMTVDESLQSKHWRPSAFSSNQKVSSEKKKHFENITFLK
jgi:hypothetical protein